MQTGIYWLKDKKYFRYILSSGVLLIPVALYFVPLQWLENQHSVCIFKNITGYECYGCGMTRAIVSAIHFHFTDAYHFNNLYVIVLPLLVFIWGKTLFQIWSGKGIL
jgi:hypothetical protein